MKIKLITLLLLFVSSFYFYSCGPGQKDTVKFNINDPQHKTNTTAHMDTVVNKQISVPIAQAIKDNNKIYENFRSDSITANKNEIAATKLLNDVTQGYKGIAKNDFMDMLKSIDGMRTDIDKQRDSIRISLLNISNFLNPLTIKKIRDSLVNIELDNFRKNNYRYF